MFTLKAVKGIETLLYLTRPYYKLNFLYNKENINRLICWIFVFLVYLNLFLLSINYYISWPRVYINTIFFSVWWCNSLYSTSCLQYLKLGAAPASLPSTLLEECVRAKKLKGFNRIGPHNLDIISIIFGSLLGKGEAEKRKDGTRIVFNHKAMHLNYSLTLHDFFFAVGYCNRPDTSIIIKELGKKGKLFKTRSFNTWTYTSFDWIYDMWYKNNVKTVPQSIGEYLTPLALAVLVMDSGVKIPLGLSFSKCFSLLECELLARVLHDNFGLKVIIYNKGMPSRYCIYIPKESMICLKNKIGNYVIPAMKYKLLD